MKRVFISKNFIISITFFVFGFCISILYGERLWKYLHPIDVMSSDFQNVKENDYILCDFKECLTKTVSNSSKGVGQSLSYFSMMRDYSEYTIVTYEGKYVRLWLYDLENIRALEKNISGDDNQIHIIGRYVSAGEPNYAWYTMDNFDKTLVISDFKILQESFKYIENMFGIGVIMTVISLMVAVKNWPEREECYVRK